MRVHLRGDVSAEQFSKLLLEIGDGDYPESEGKATIPEGLGSVVTTLEDPTTRIYPDIADMQEKSMNWLGERAILTPKNDNAAVINEVLLNSFEGAEMEYWSVNSVVQTDDAVHYPVEFLHSLNPPGF